MLSNQNHISYNDYYSLDNQLIILFSKIFIEDLKNGLE